MYVYLDQWGRRVAGNLQKERKVSQGWEKRMVEEIVE